MLLRPCEPADAQAVFEAEHESLPELQKWFWWCHPEHSPQRCSDWAASRCAEWERGQEFAFLICPTEQDTVVGCVWINALDPIARRGSLGYWVRSSWSGRGVASRAARVVVDWAFSALSLERIEIVAAIANRGSQRVAEKLGGDREGIARSRLRVAGCQQDAIVYSLLRADWDGKDGGGGNVTETRIRQELLQPAVACGLSVVIPVRDEEYNLPGLIDRLRQSVSGITNSFEVIFITDINEDRTLEVLRAAHDRDERIKAIKLSDGHGQHVAALAGLRACRGQAVVLMDGDLQDYPEDIPALFDRLQMGFDVVYGLKEKKDDSPWRNLLSKAFVAILNRLSDRRVDHNTSMFRIMSRRVVDQLCRFEETEPHLTGLVALLNLPTDRVLVTSGEREAGRTKYSLLRQINMAISFLLAFSTKPLRLISVFGIFVAALSFLYLVITVAQALITGIPVQGWATLVSLVTFLSGVQLLALGTIGEYVGRIFLETKGRPLYIVEETIGDLATERLHE